MQAETDDEELRDVLSRVPYRDRVILLPQCLRSNRCTASRGRYGVLNCMECGRVRDDGMACPLAGMTAAARRVGYGGVYIFTGGSGIVPFFKEKGLPRAVLAVACRMELEEGLEAMRALGIPAQVVPLLQDGCAETCFAAGEDHTAAWEHVLTAYPPAGEA